MPRTPRKAAVDKYALYSRAVQQPDVDVRFFRELYRELKGKTPKILREDFCGTFSVCCEWVKLGPGYRAYGRDLSPEPILYGRAHHLPRLSAAQRARVRIEEGDVRKPGGPPADIAVAMNFSYSAFKTRADFKRYLVSSRRGLRPGGVLALDCFGGPGVQKPNVERTVHRGFVYYWEQSGFDPVSGEARCAIHFKPRGRRKLKDVFTYDWRLWTLPEIRDLLAEAGFRKSHVYWEGDDGRKGNGIFTRAGKLMMESVWIAFIAAER